MGRKTTPRMSNNPLEQGSTFEFHVLDAPCLPSLQSKATSERLQKWDLDQHANVLKFRFDQPFERLSAGDFIRDFFSDPVVQEVFKVVDATGRWQQGPGAPSAVQFQQLNTTITSMSFFDCLKQEEGWMEQGPIISDEGRISPTFEEWVEGMCLQDRLRIALAHPDSEDYEILTDAQRQELITTVFRHLVLGGGMNQWDDHIEPYVEQPEAFTKISSVFAKTQKQIKWRLRRWLTKSSPWTQRQTCLGIRIRRIIFACCASTLSRELSCAITSVGTTHLHRVPIKERITKHNQIL